MSSLTEVFDAQRASERRRMVEMAAEYCKEDIELSARLKAQASRKDALRQWMQLEGESECIDEETGAGVRLDEHGRRDTKWDTRSIADEWLLLLREAGCLTIHTPTFDLQRKNAPAAWLDEIQRRYRLDGESEPALRAVKP